MPQNTVALIRYPQEKTNTEALPRYSWNHGGLQIYKNSPLTPMTHKKHPKIKQQQSSRTTANDHLILLPSLLASTVIIAIATMSLFFINNIACNSSLEAMITTATEFPIIKATIFGKNNNDYKTYTW